MPAFSRGGSGSHYRTLSTEMKKFYSTPPGKRLLDSATNRPLRMAGGLPGQILQAESGVNLENLAGNFDFLYV